MLHVVVCYDVSEDSRRQRLAKEVVRHLERVQKSTFEGTITPQHLAAIRKAAAEIIDHETDSLRIYYLCGGCWPKTEIEGKGVYVEGDEADILL